MENQKYNELLTRASHRELTVNDMNDLMLVLDSRMNRKDAEDRNRDKAIAKSDRSIRDIEEEYPLLPPEADDLAKAVQRKGVWVMGGKKKPAYQDKTLRTTIYRDIYTEVKRNYGLIDSDGRQKSYKKLRRKYLNGALNVVEQYELPVHLQNEVDALNEIEFED